MERILVVCAHPDDETIGLGGTIAKHIENGDKVFVLIFTDGESGRIKSNKKIIMRKNQAKKATSILGINEIKFLGYSDQMLDTKPSLVLVKQLEKIIKKWNPDTVYTHYWGDVNQDHRKVFDATLIATRPTPSSKIKRIICYEILSSTEWGNENFKPNLFIEISKFLKKKIKAFKVYKYEINPFPHPRSEESIISRSRYWGSTVGTMNAEAFIILRDIVKEKTKK